MPDEPPLSMLNRALASRIVAAYVRRNEISVDQMPSLVATVYRTLVGLGSRPPEAAIVLIPAVPIRRSFQRDRVTCLDCGWSGKMLRRHVGTAHGFNVEQYRARWNLPHEHPIVSPNYSEQRSGLAKQAGLGRRRRASAEAQEAA